MAGVGDFAADAECAQRSPRDIPLLESGPGSSGDLNEDRLKSRASRGLDGVTFFRDESSSGITKAHAVRLLHAHFAGEMVD